VEPFPVFNETGKRIWAFAGSVGDATGAVEDGIAVKVGMDVLVARVTGVLVGNLIGVEV
jgi:hypothetical protein